MTVALVLVDALFTALAGAAVTGLVRGRLTVLERVCCTVVAGTVLSSAATFALALFAGLSVATVLAGPLWIAVLALIAAHWLGNPYDVWRTELGDALRRWRQHPPVAMLCVAAVSAAVIWLLYARTVTVENGALVAGYETVWADWAQHLTTAAGFAVASNLPPANPLFSGTPLLYPFLPDFHAATLMVLGMDGGGALALGSGVLALTLVMLVIALARRLGLSLGAGIVAVMVTLIGGGLGFVGVFGDACTSAGYNTTQCSAGYVFTHAQGVAIAAATLQHIPGLLAAQPRAYDGLLSANSALVFPDQQWYTPLFAWWLPQRSMLYGFDAALVILLIVLAALRTADRAWAAFTVAGVLLGLMPLVHAQTFFVLVVWLLVLVVRHRRREWLALCIATGVIAAPRLAQIAAAPHGSAAYGDAYPFFDPGWASNTGSSLAFTAANAGRAVVTAITQLGGAQWWGFWLINLGVAVPLCVVTTLALIARRLRGAVGRAALRGTAFLTSPFLELFIGALVVFALCDVVVFQSWYWDNTKLLVYWYLITGLLAGAVATRWWRRSWWRTALAVVVPGSMVLTGVVVVLRLLPWTPSQDSVTGPYTISSAADTAMAQQFARTTPGGAVVLTVGDTNDPLQVVAGRTAVMGYYGWLWSYGTAFGTRIADVQAMYAGCSGNTPCQVVALLHRYHVSYVEVDSGQTDSGTVSQPVNTTWWAQQGYPVVARSPGIVVYDVRNA